MNINQIYNIDCTDGMKQLPSNNQYCIVTDPPFNVGYHYNTYSDKKSENEYYEWLADIIGNYPCAIIHYPEPLYKLSFQIGRFPDKVVSWVYNSNTPRQHRDIAFFDIHPDFSKVTQPYKNLKDKRIIERLKNGKGGTYVRLD